MLGKVVLKLLCFVLVDSYIIAHETGNNNSENFNMGFQEDAAVNAEEKAADAFNGVYTECLLHLSYTCIQKKTLLYLKKLNTLDEISVIGDYVTFVKTNRSEYRDIPYEVSESGSSEELSSSIDRTVDNFFENHVLRFKALGRDISVPKPVDEFVGRKKRKGGGGGGGHDHDDSKKKMMMMGMMCMKMKLMMMIPAMMGMMGMMSFKSMMFSMMSFMLSKMMLLMKLLEKKGGLGGGVGDAGWAAGGGAGGAWMPAGGPDYGGGGGGYDANGQWQSRSILESTDEDITFDKEKSKSQVPYIAPVTNYKRFPKKRVNDLKSLSDAVIKIKNAGEMSQNENKYEENFKIDVKSRSKRGIVDVIQNAYLYWISKLIGQNRFNKNVYSNYPKYRIINGVKYVYSPVRAVVKHKVPKAVQQVSHETNIKDNEEDFKPIVTVQDFNKGEIVEVPEESRMHKKKLMKMKQTVDEAVEDNPWE